MQPVALQPSLLYRNPASCIESSFILHPSLQRYRSTSQCRLTGRRLLTPKKLFHTRQGRPGPSGTILGQSTARPVEVVEIMTRCGPRRATPQCVQVRIKVLGRRLAGNRNSQSVEQSPLEKKTPYMNRYALVLVRIGKLKTFLARRLNFHVQRIGPTNSQLKYEKDIELTKSGIW